MYGFMFDLEDDESVMESIGFEETGEGEVTNLSSTSLMTELPHQKAWFVLFDSSSSSGVWNWSLWLGVEEQVEDEDEPKTKKKKNSLSRLLF